MRRLAGARRYSQKVVNTVILIVILALLLYLGIQISRGFYSKVSTQRVQSVTEAEYLYLDGCIFRDDSAIRASGDIVYYTVQNGEKVGVGQVYAEVYSDTGLSETERAEVEKRLNSLSAAIALIEGGLGSGGSASHLGQINENILSGYYSYVDSILAGDLASADKAGDRLLSGLVDYSSLTAGDAARDRLSLLVEERDRILASIGGTKRALVSDRSFNFFYGADGYEDALHSSSLNSLTRAELDLLMSQKPQSTDGIIGRATEDSKWYIAFPLDSASLEVFRSLTGNSFTVDFLGFDGLEITMLLENVIQDDNEEGGAYMIMSSRSLAHAASLDRLQSVRILLGTSTGYRVPIEAMHTLDGHEGVYVLVGNVIEFRRASVIGKGSDYYIIAPFESDSSSVTDQSIPYLNINDMIVTSGRDLYDGKQLD